MFRHFSYFFPLLLRNLFALKPLNLQLFLLFSFVLPRSVTWQDLPLLLEGDRVAWQGIPLLPEALWLFTEKNLWFCFGRLWMVVIFLLWLLFTITILVITFCFYESFMCLLRALTSNTMHLYDIKASLRKF